jgi:hypothetical protein
MAIGDPFIDMTVSPFFAVRSPGVDAVTFRGSNFGVIIGSGTVEDGVAISPACDRESNGVAET